MNDGWRGYIKERQFYSKHRFDCGIISPNRKSYSDTLDMVLRNARLNDRQYDPGHIMENLIYNELLRCGYSVDVGVVYDRKGGANIPKEIDFVVNDGDRKLYVQSAFQMDTITKEDSELKS